MALLPVWAMHPNIDETGPHITPILISGFNIPKRGAPMMTSTSRYVPLRGDSYSCYSGRQITKRALALSIRDPRRVLQCRSGPLQGEDHPAGPSVSEGRATRIVPRIRLSTLARLPTDRGRCEPAGRSPANGPCRPRIDAAGLRAPLRGRPEALPDRLEEPRKAAGRPNDEVVSLRPRPLMSTPERGA